MFKIFAAAVFSAISLSAQTAQTTLFRAVMQPVSGGDSGVADILVHVVKDAGQNILSGSVEFDLTYQFPADEAVTGLTLANGAAVIATNISAASPVQATAGAGRIHNQVQAAASDLSSLLSNSGQYTVSLSTSEHPAGAMSGALQAGSMAVRMALLSSSAGTGVATVQVFYTGLPDAISSGEVFIQLTYQFPSRVTFSGMRIYSGTQIVAPAQLAPGTPSSAGGAGLLTAPPTEIDMGNVQMVQGVQNILTGASSYSVNVDTVENPGAPLTGQVRRTDVMTFQVPAFAGPGAASEVSLYTLRESSGSVAAGTVVFDVNYRLGAGVQIDGIDIDGNILVPAVATDPTGSGNVYAVVGVNTGPGLTSLNGIVADPEAHQIHVQSTASATALSAALAAADTTPAVVNALLSNVQVTTLSTFAPGSFVDIWGTNLAKVTTDLSGWPGTSLPASLNGVTVSVGGQPARILYVSPIQVDVLLPFETPPGAQTLTLNNGNSPSVPIPISIAGAAPAIYNYPFKNADFSLVSASNPAHAGDVLVFFTTGMGQTTPVLTTGQITPLGSTFFYTATVTATMGGVNANVIYSIAAPPYVTGLYQMAVTVPTGLGPGSVPFVATSGGQQSNPVMVEVR